MRLAIAIVLASACRPSAAPVPAPKAAPASASRIGIAGLDERLAAARVGTYTKQGEKVPAPMSLSPADGNELELKSLEAAVTIEGPLAHTELHFAFHNAEHRIREGRFAITLPDGAAVSRFAMKLDDGWREARVVSRTKGRQVYDRFLHERVDPALLEQDAGNQFSARVFPIPADADKELIIAYDHVVSASHPYTLALRGLAPIPRLAVMIDRDGTHRAFDRAGLPPEDVVVEIADRAEAIAGNGAFVARLDPMATPELAPLDRVLVLVDTSASRAPIMGRQAAVVRGILAGLPAGAEVAVAAFDHDVSELYRGKAGDAGAVVDALLDHGALGASDLGRALDRATTAGLSRVVLVGDGTPTLGEPDVAKLAAIVRGSAIQRLDAVQVGQSVDREALGAIVAAGKRPGAILDGRDPERVVVQLATALPAEVAIAVDGAKTWPATTRGVAPGEPVWVFGLGAGPLAIHVGNRTVRLEPAAADAHRIRRAVAGAELAALADQMNQAPEAARGTLAKQIEAIALEHQLVSSQTSLLVLESDAIEHRVLDTPPTETVSATGQPRGETIVINGTAPIIDQGSTRQGITLTNDYARNIPVGRTFGEVLGSAAGSQNDSFSISGATSLENTYIVEGINTTGGSGIAVSGWLQPLMPLWIEHHFEARALGFPLPQAPDEDDSPPPQPVARAAPPAAPVEPPPPPSVYTGELARVMSSLAQADKDRALEIAATWQLGAPGDVASIVALGEALEARGDLAGAARAYGSIADLYPNRAELLRATGERFDRLADRDPAYRQLAVDAYRRALHERPDQIPTYRLLAYALLRADRGEEALDVLLDGRKHAHRESITAILTEDTTLVASAIIAKHPEKRDAIAKRSTATKLGPSLRVILTWETDANDVDLHVKDRGGDESWYSHRQLASGGALRDDITDGFGPEMFEVDDPHAFPYAISAHYYRRGPMGIGLGSVQVIRSDGAGNLTIEDRPFAIQVDGARVDLGTVH